MSDFNKDEFSNFRDKPDMSMIWLKHLDRTNMAAGNIEELYNAYVRQQLRLLPTQWQIWVLDQADTYSEPKTVFEYEENWGIRLGSEGSPKLYNPRQPVKTLPDGSIDWEDSNIRSPKRKTVAEIDYEKFNLLVLTAAENAGLSWKTEPTNSEYGLYPDDKEEDIGTQTPVYNLKKNPNLEQSFLRKPKWINFKGSPKLITNYLGYACGVGPGEKPWFFSEIRHRQKKQRPIVILVTGTQGTGKTYAAIRIAEIFDKRFVPEKQIAMDRSMITKLVSGRGKLRRNQTIIIDESQFGANARSWANKDQQSLMNFLAAARFYGYIIIIVALHRSMLDSIIRERIVNFHIHMEDRGVSTVYEPRHARFDENPYPSRKGRLVLQLPDYDRCDFVTCLTCKKKSDCKTVRARYERMKTEFVQSEAELQDQLEQEAKQSKLPYSTLAELKEGLLHKQFEISYKGNGEVNVTRTSKRIRDAGFKLRHREESELIEALGKPENV